MAQQPEFRISFYWDSKKKHWMVLGRMMNGRVFHTTVDNTVSLDQTTARLLMLEVEIALSELLPL